MSATPTPFIATVSTKVADASANRREVYIKNDCDKDGYVLLLTGGTVSTTVYTDIVKAFGGRFRTDYRGEVIMIMAAAPTSGQCLVSEIA